MTRSAAAPHALIPPRVSNGPSYHDPSCLHHILLPFLCDSSGSSAEAWTRAGTSSQDDAPSNVCTDELYPMLMGLPSLCCSFTTSFIVGRTKTISSSVGGVPGILHTGPTGIGMWLQSWQVFSNACVMLDIIDPGTLTKYRDLIERFHNLWCGNLGAPVSSRYSLQAGNGG